MHFACFPGQVNSRLPTDGDIVGGGNSGTTATSLASTPGLEEQVGGSASSAGVAGGGGATGATRTGSGGRAGEPAPSSGTVGVGVVGSAAQAGTSRTLGKPLVKLDLYHAENRFISCGSKKNGAYGPFCAAARDTFAIPCPEAMDDVRSVWKLRNPSWNDQEIASDMRAKYASHLLKHVPRIVPPPEILLPRFDNLVETFKNVRDVTGTTVVACIATTHWR